MLEVRKFDSFEDDREKVCCIRCGGSIDVVLDAGLMKIGLCKECLDLVTVEIIDLQGELKRSCLRCMHWQRPDGSYRCYDGQCLLGQGAASYIETCPSFTKKEDA